MPDQPENIEVRAEESDSAPLSHHPKVGFHSGAPIFLTASGRVTSSPEEAATIIQSARRRPTSGAQSVAVEPPDFFYPFGRGEPLTTDELIDSMSIMLDQVNAATSREE